MVKLTISENSVANTTVIPNSRKNWPMMPLMKAIGVNTTTLVRVEASTATPTSAVPLAAASRGSTPSCTRREIFSNTTIELVTSVPIEMPRAISDITFRVKPLDSISRNEAITETGMAKAAIRV